MEKLSILLLVPSSALNDLIRNKKLRLDTKWFIGEAFITFVSTFFSSLSNYFMNLFGFSNNISTEGYYRSNLIPNVDKVKFLKLYCNLVNNSEDNEFLTNVFIKGNISEQVTYENDNIYKSKNILNTSFDFIEICIKDQHNETC